MDAKTFKEYRQKLGLSQAQLSRLLGFKDDGRNVRRIEAGERTIAGPVDRLLTWLATGKKPTIDN